MTAAEVLAELAAVRLRLVAELEHFDDVAFARTAPGGGWSAGQIAEHLARVESGIVRGARAAVERGNGVRPGLLDPLRRLPMRLGIMQFLRVRTIRRADPAAEPGEVLARAPMLARLAQVRAGTVAFLEETRARDLRHLYLRHPFFGAFPVRDMLGWAAWHEERHRRQLVRLRGALGR